MWLNNLVEVILFDFEEDPIQLLWELLAAWQEDNLLPAKFRLSFANDYRVAEIYFFPGTIQLSFVGNLFSLDWEPDRLDEAVAGLIKWLHQEDSSLTLETIHECEI